MSSPVRLLGYIKDELYLRVSNSCSTLSKHESVYQNRNKERKMAIPDFQSLLLPVLKCAEKEEIHIRKAIEILGDQFSLSEEERRELVQSGRVRTFDNRVHWSNTYLKKAGLLTSPKRGFFIATDEGRRVLAESPERIDVKFLKKFKGFRDFHNRKGRSTDKDNQVETVIESESTPDEDLRKAYEQINAGIAEDILERVRSSTPQFFEDLILKLLLAMGYGGTSEDAARALGKSGDNGVDGVVDQDSLGVDQIYVQAKRYDEGNNVGAGEIRNFCGALSQKKVQKGIFFTTSKFSNSARQTATEVGMRIVLIDGDLLARLMIRHNVGCRDEDVLYLKKVDEEFFEL